MSVRRQIDRYIDEQAPAKRDDLKALDERIGAIAPNSRLWFLDGRDDTGRIVSNPNVGYGVQTQRYASGETREFYRVGLSANTSGISVYIMGLDDKTFLARSYGARLGKAKVTGYCVKFRALKDVDLGVLEEMIARHLAGA
jgi:hypothetical protein